MDTWCLNSVYLFSFFWGNRKFLVAFREVGHRTPSWVTSLQLTSWQWLWLTPVLILFPNLRLDLPKCVLSWHFRINYCHAIEWRQMGFGLVIGFIGHVQLVPIINYNSFANSNTSQLTVTQDYSSQSSLALPGNGSSAFMLNGLRPRWRCFTADCRHDSTVWL
jgi:hypothetical protein